MIRFLANVGDVASLIIHPATTTHAALDADAQVAAGVRPEQLRLSVGLEGADAICADLDAALAEADA
jgi:O-acetylhomoserine (thiol)-lyase